MKPTVETIWNEFAAKLGQFIAARVADPATAEDILQDVFVKIQSWLGQLQDPAKLRGWLLQPKPFEVSPMYLYVTRVAGALMLGWTVLLFWAQRKPIARAGVLLITLFPVVSSLAVAAVLVAKSDQIAVSRLVPMFIFYGVLNCTFIPSYVWARRQNRD